MSDTSASERAALSRAKRDPHPNAPGAEVGIDEALIERVVVAFYAKVRREPLLGPIFEGMVADWPSHLVRLRDFWSSLVLLTGRYKGAPFEAHLAMPELGTDHFGTWLRLFDEALAEHCDPAQAEVFRARAERVAESLRLGLAMRRGDPPVGGVPVR